MGNLAYFVLIVSFLAVIAWYATAAATGRGAEFGLFGMKAASDREEAASTGARANAAARLRARVVNGSSADDPAENED